MKYCKECGEIFDEEDAHYKDCGFWCEFWGHDVYDKEYEMQCPYCRSDKLDDCVCCDECGEECRPEDLDENWLCECCREEKVVEDEQDD